MASKWVKSLIAMPVETASRHAELASSLLFRVRPLPRRRTNGLLLLHQQVHFLANVAKTRGITRRHSVATPRPGRGECAVRTREQRQRRIFSLQADSRHPRRQFARILSRRYLTICRLACWQHPKGRSGRGWSCLSRSSCRLLPLSGCARSRTSIHRRVSRQRV